MLEGLTDWLMRAVEVDMMLMDLPTILFSMHHSWHGDQWEKSFSSPLSQRLHFWISFYVKLRRCIVLEICGFYRVSILKLLFWIMWNVEEIIYKSLFYANMSIDKFSRLNCNPVSASLFVLVNTWGKKCHLRISVRQRKTPFKVSQGFSLSPNILL